MCVKTRQALNTWRRYTRFMDEMSSDQAYHFPAEHRIYTPDEVRELLSELFGYQDKIIVRVFPPFYADFRKNITVGEGSIY